MSKFAQFMKGNKVVKENQFYAATKSLCDENGDPLKWEFRKLSTQENEEIRESCTVDIPIPGKHGAFRPKVKSSKYIQTMIARSVVYPDLFDKELQDSYGVRTPEELLMAMVDDAGEYSDLAVFVQKLNGFDVSFEDEVNEAKN